MSRSDKLSNGLSVSGEATMVEDAYESSMVLMVSTNVDDCEWIMDFGYSFFIYDFKSLHNLKEVLFFLVTIILVR